MTDTRTLQNTDIKPTPADATTILIVEDEPDLANLYERWLDPDYTVKTAHSGAKALDVIDESVDIVLLDRRLPEMSGDEVLTSIRNRGLRCQVIIVSAIAPAADILELGFDDYLTKPTTLEEVRRVLDRAETRILFGRKYQEFISLAAKLATIETMLDIETLQQDPTYATLQSQFTDLVSELRTLPIGDPEYSEFYRLKLQAVLENTLGQELEVAP